MLTLDHLKRIGRVLANRCFLCEEEEESIDHLLVHCSKARVLWDLLLVIVGFSPHWLGRPFSFGVGLLLGRDTRKLGWQPLYALFGLFGLKEIVLLLITKNFLCKI